MIRYCSRGKAQALPRQGTSRSTRHAVEAGTDGIESHLLHVLRFTDLEKDYLAGSIQCLTLDGYAQHLNACLSILPPHITDDGTKRDLIAPAWSADKKTGAELPEFHPNSGRSCKIAL